MLRIIVITRWVFAVVIPAVTFGQTDDALREAVNIALQKEFACYDAGSVFLSESTYTDGRRCHMKTIFDGPRERCRIVLTMDPAQTAAGPNRWTKFRIEHLLSAQQHLQATLAINIDPSRFERPPDDLDYDSFLELVPAGVRASVSLNEVADRGITSICAELFPNAQPFFWGCVPYEGIHLALCALETRERFTCAREMDGRVIVSFGDDSLSLSFERKPDGSLRLLSVKSIVLVEKDAGRNERVPFEISVTKRDENDRMISFDESRAGKVFATTRLLGQRQRADDDSLDAFKGLHVPNGQRVITQDGRHLEYHDGKAVVPIDRDAELTIAQVLGRTSAYPQTLVRSKYLRRTSSAAQCGVYSLAVAAAKCGHDIPIEELVSGPYVASPRGSSLSDLVAAADRFGLHTRVVRQADWRFLRGINKPAILRFSNRLSIDSTSHWVTLIQIDGRGECVLVDCPRPPAQVSVAELLSYWDGTAIIVSDEPIPAIVLQANRIHTLLPGLALLSGILFVSALTRCLRLSQRWETFGLVISAFTVAGLWLCTAMDSFPGNQFAANVVKSKSVDSTPLPQDSSVTVFDQTDIAIVDARLPQDFYMGHVANAVNIPIDASICELRDGFESIRHSRCVVVYCQSDSCPWANALGNRLKRLGIGNVVVYKPGYKGFLEATCKTQAGQ